MNSKKLPIMEFKNDEELMTCLREWKKILFLEDWTIKGVLVDAIDSEEGLSGRNNFVMVIKCSMIRLLKPTEDVRDRIAKYCAEQILVHELLHCKYNWVESKESLEAVYYDTLEHSLLDQMSKSLIMAKYGLTFDWFENF